MVLQESFIVYAPVNKILLLIVVRNQSYPLSFVQNLYHTGCIADQQKIETHPD